MIYDVFINHRGPDVKRSFASLIYYRLKIYGLNVFLDKNEMKQGEIIPDAIRNAIQTAWIHIAFFSPRYAESTWCLEELHLMLESYKNGRSSIITVFSDVKPSDLRHIESGSYAGFFKSHESKGRDSEKDLIKWKEALQTASYISGIELLTEKSDYGEFVEEVAKRILNLEDSKLEPVEIPKSVVGLRRAAEDFQIKFRQAEKAFQRKNLVANNSKPTVIVEIVGMVGVGKSTLAKYLYRAKRSGFTASSFLKDVSKQELLPLQRKLHHDLFLNNDLQCVPTDTQAKSIIRKHIRHLSSVLIVLDDVHGAGEKGKIESLLDMEFMASGSLVLITSRERLFLKRIFAKLENVMTLVYEVKPLKEEHARELFCRHAFDQSTPPEGFEDSVVQSLQICGGLPLSLEILGGLCFVDKEEWTRQLKGFSPPKDIIDRLKGSYEALDTEEKKVFLDIGCFLDGVEHKLAIRVLKGLYANINIEDCVTSLRRKCLVDDPMIGYNHTWRSLNMISMPNPLSKLARAIARKEFGTHPPQPQRFSCSNDIETMSEMSSSFQTWGIRFSKTPAFGEGTRVNTDGVRLFVADGRIDLSSFFDSWVMSGELVWLRLGNLNYFRFPGSISLQTLRVLELEGQEDHVEHFFRNILYHAGRRDLNTVDAGASTSSSSPARKPSILGSVKGVLLNFRNWQQQSVTQSLERIVPATLTTLELKNITSLKSLPIDFSRLPNLTQLDLSGCLNLTELPCLSNLLKLEFLNINECSNLETLNVEGLTLLKEIKALGCWKLKRIGDLKQRGLLNCLYISTDNSLIWNDICEFLASPSHQKPSTAIFSGRREDDKRVLNLRKSWDIHGKIARAENLGNAEIPIWDIHLYGAIMVLFITDARSPEFSVTIKQSHDGSSGSTLEYRTARANRGGRCVNALIFHVSKECNSGIDVCCSHLDSILEGRIVMVYKDADVPKVCEEIIKVYI